MTSIPISDRLLRSAIVSGKARDEELALAFETGEATTRAARRAPDSALVRAVSRFIKSGKKYRAPSDDAEKRRVVRRKWGGGGTLPPELRAVYSEGERAVLNVIGEEVKKSGACELAIETICKRAGVTRTTAQNAIRKARADNVSHLAVQLRPVPGQKNMTNRITIISRKWLRWIKQSIGFKSMNPFKSKIQEPLSQSSEGPSQRALEREKAASLTQDLVRRGVGDVAGQVRSIVAGVAAAVKPHSGEGPTIEVGAGGWSRTFADARGPAGGGTR